MRKGRKNMLLIMTAVIILLNLAGCAGMGAGEATEPPAAAEEYPIEEQMAAMPQLTDATISYDPETPDIVTITFIFEGEYYGEELSATAVARLSDFDSSEDEFDVIYIGEGMFEVTVQLLEDSQGRMWRVVDITLEDEMGNTSAGGVGIGTSDGIPRISWRSIGSGASRRILGLSSVQPFR